MDSADKPRNVGLAWVVEQLSTDPKGFKELMGLKADADPSLVYEPKGCELCNNQGYRGRTGIFELIRVDGKPSMHDS